MLLPKHPIFFILLSALLFSCIDDEEAPLPTWMDQGLSEQRVNEIKLEGQTLFAATQDGMYRKSVNSQDTMWTAAGLSGREVTDFVLFNENELLASVTLGPDNPATTLYRTEDGGSSWTAVESNFGGESGSITCQALALSPRQSDVLYGRGSYNVAKSTDGGQSWVSILAEWNNIGYQADLMYVDPNDANIVWAGGETSIFSPYLIKSTDAGQTWIPQDIPADGDNAVYSIVTHPDDNQRVLVGMEGQIVYTENGGDSWEVLYSPDTYSYFYDLQVSATNNDRAYAVGTDGGTDLGNVLLFVTNDFGQQWDMLQYEGMDGKEYAALDMAVSMIDGQETIFIGTNHGVVRYNR